MKKIYGRPAWWRPDLAAKDLEADLRAGFEGDALFPQAEPQDFKDIQKAEIFACLIGTRDCQATLWDRETGIPARYFYSAEDFALQWMGHPDARALPNGDRITWFLEADAESTKWMQTLGEKA